MTAYYITNTITDYHTDTKAISKSMLSRFIESPASYRDCFVTKTVDPWGAGTPSMRLGTIVHCLVLEPEKASETFAVAPRWALSGSGAKTGKTWKRFKQSIGDKLPITQDEYDVAKRMADGVLATLPEFVGKEGVVEQSFYWTDEATGLPMRCRPDKLFNFPELAVIIDLKTEGGRFAPSFEEAFHDYGYGLQVAHYVTGIEKCLKKKVEFRFAVVDPNGDTRLFSPPGWSMSESFQYRTAVIESLKKCYDTDVWPEEIELAA